MSLTENLPYAWREKLRDTVNSGYAIRDGLIPSRRREKQAISDQRARVENQILAAEPNLSPASLGPVTDGPVLIDGTWDNANWWFRLSMLRSALGISDNPQIGLLGRWRRPEISQTMQRFGIKQTISLHPKRDRQQRLDEAHALLSQCRQPEDMLALKLPHGLPATLFYDTVLRHQQRGVVDLEDRYLPDYFAEMLSTLHRAHDIIEQVNPSMVIMAQCISAYEAPFAWLAIQRGIPLIVGYGDYGTQRFIRMSEPWHVFHWHSRPSPDEWNELTSDQWDSLRSAGRTHMQARLEGRSNDIGSEYAFRRRTEHTDRAKIAAMYNWDPSKPLVCVYAPNWYDYPHTCQMTTFRDSVEWSLETVKRAQSSNHANWLFKAHPCDDIYGVINGLTLAEMVTQHEAPHLGLVPREWGARELMMAVDGVVTFQGTVGLEAATLGKPALVADHGWYAEFGFAHFPGTRESYLDALVEPWWETVEPEEKRIECAEAFAGFYFGKPDWQSNLTFLDDSGRAALYPAIKGILDNNFEELRLEVAAIRSWYDSGERFYHAHKMKHAGQYVVGNITN